MRQSLRLCMVIALSPLLLAPVDQQKRDAPGATQGAATKGTNQAKNGAIEPAQPTPSSSSSELQANGSFEDSQGDLLPTTQGERSPYLLIALAVVLSSLVSLIGGWLLHASLTRRIETLRRNLLERMQSLHFVAGQEATVAQSDTSEGFRAISGSRAARILSGGLGSETAWTTAPVGTAPSENATPPEPVEWRREAPSAQPVRRTFAPKLPQLAERLSALAADQTMKKADYDQMLERIGTASGIDVAPDGLTATLDDGASDPFRRLVALQPRDTNEVIILPSARFIKDFSQTYKESLEAGDDVLAVYECIANGRGALEIVELAVGRVTPENQVMAISRGRLGGFVR